MAEYIIWNTIFQGYRPRDVNAKHGGIFAAQRFPSRGAAIDAAVMPGDLIEVVKDNGIPEIISYS